MRTTRTLSTRYGYLLAVFSVIAATALFYPGKDYFGKEQWALLYLLIVVFVAALSGYKPALLVAVLSFFAWNYFFLPPYHTLIVTDPKDWLSLIVFLTVGILMGLQTGRLRERESHALSREKETALLNRFSARIVSEISIEEMAEVLIKEVSEITFARAVALYLLDEKGMVREVLSIPALAGETRETLFRRAESAYLESKSSGFPSLSELSDPSRITRPQDLFLPLLTTTQHAGMLYVGERSDGKPHSLPEIRLLMAIAYQAAVFIERKRLQHISIQADALRETDRLKSTLISSVSHELKTPLASANATVTSMLEGDTRWDSLQVRDELQTVKSDLERLNRSIGSLVDLSRLEDASWIPRKEPYELGEILGSVLANIPEKKKGRILFALEENLPLIEVDFVQWARGIQNLVENALAYSPESSPVTIGAKTGNGELVLWVEDAGPGIPPEERSLVFEKFYRGSSSKGVSSGTGLGLAVTKEIVRFHGGTIALEAVKPHGAKFVITLPLRKESHEHY
ncbi:MAG: DUF4118 domain-containing protein [Candidatus Eremiobacteraeota bacterium]|nr:DUF4118 domain-containing protein [Candidatus Eremiobacteraeota bacterium]